MNKYTEYKQRRQKEVNDFPFIYAFSREQLEKKMKELEVKDLKELYSLGAGTYIRKNDSKKMEEMFDNHEEEFKKLIAEDNDGNNFIYDMFFYELNNHEFIVTYDIEDTLNALGMTREDIEKDSRLQHGLNKAIKEITK